MQKAKRAIKIKILLWAMPVLLPLLLCIALLFMLASILGGNLDSDFSGDSNNVKYTGVYTEELPIFPEIKGRGKIPDEIAQYAVGVGVKYRILPSLAIGQWAFESAWGTSPVSKTDNNFFGVTWFEGAPFPKGSPRGVGGSEGGNYMKFPSKMASFSYYGYMLASQANFNRILGVTDLGQSLDIIDAGGYAAAGTGKGSSYYANVQDIYAKNNLGELDAFAQSRWNDFSFSPGENIAGIGNVSVLDNVLGTTVYDGQCYDLSAVYVERMGGPRLKGSNKFFAEKIGEDYDWGQYGWQVIIDPKPSDLKAGDIVNWYANGPIAVTVWGHTGIISHVANGGEQFNSYEQNAEQGQIVAKYSRTYSMNKIRSIVRKVK